MEFQRYNPSGTMNNVPQPPGGIERPLFSRAFLISVAGILLAAGSYFVYVSGAPARAASKSFEALLAGTETATVTFYTIDPVSGHTPPEKRQGAYLRDWKILQEKVLRDPRDVQRIRSILSSSGTYGTEAFHCFDPGLGFRFQTESRRIELVICLACRQIYAYEGDRRKFWILSESGVKKLYEVYETHAETNSKK